MRVRMSDRRNEAAAIRKIEPLLDTGTVDPDEYVPEYPNKLKAGIDKVQAEQQKQLEAWVAENKKEAEG